ncbi:hypothetical protein [Flavobacterium foetidum]|uniref:hypothetical protein n=1 Tax=Flavobacterium foetidum TaxID=2026681 RepID=UPI0010757DF1|nr:hypothetical protein [Flavobacterium foetidum]KAF2510609.1 hypothetical protein E0W73_17980 [Flavobacterium foetidum]
MKEEKVPFESMQFGGVQFKVINRHKAHEIIGSLADFNNQKIYNVFEDTWRFPDYEENPVFLLAEDDVQMDVLEMEFSTDENPDVFILGFIFKKDLIVNKLISSYDTDNSPALIVLGKTTTINITLFGSVHYLGGGLQCDTLLGEYNHGELYVKGEVSAWLIYTDDMNMHFEGFNNVQAVINAGRPDILICSRLTDTDGSIIYVENYFPSTHKLSDVVADSFLEHDEVYDRETFIDDYYNTVFKKGDSFIDHNKEDRYLYTGFRDNFIDMIQTLSDKLETKNEESLFYDDGSTNYSFVHFEYDDKKYSQIAATILNGFNIRMRGLWCTDTQEILLLLEYLDEAENTKYQWMNDETAEGIEFYSIKHAVVSAFEALNKDYEEDDDDKDYEDDDELSLEEFSTQFGARKMPDYLAKLFDFQSHYGEETFSECFYLHTIDKTGLKTWSEDEAFYDSFIEFARANGSGSSYAYWLIDNDLNKCPIVVFGDEGGIHVVAENTQKLISLLTYDTEISVDFDKAYFYKDEDYYQESENLNEFIDWVKNGLGLPVVKTDEDADAIINQAKILFGEKLNAFLAEFDIETQDEENF